MSILLISSGESQQNFIELHSSNQSLRCSSEAMDSSLIATQNKITEAIKPQFIANHQPPTQMPMGFAPINRTAKPVPSFSQTPIPSINEKMQAINHQFASYDQSPTQMPMGFAKTSTSSSPAPAPMGFAPINRTAKPISSSNQNSSTPTGFAPINRTTKPTSSSQTATSSSTSTSHLLNSSQVMKTVKPSKPFNKMSDAEVWQYLHMVSTSWLNIIKTSTIAVLHRFHDILSSSSTNISSIHANYLNKKMKDGQCDTSYREQNLHFLTKPVNFGEERSFIASQAPICKGQFDDTTFDYWKVIFDESAAIFDLTHRTEIYSPKTADLSQVSHYYPTGDNKTLEYTNSKGEKLELTETSAETMKTMLNNEEVTIGHVHKYQIKMNSSGQETVKTITRYHFSQWQDHNAVDDYMLKEIIKKIKDEVNLPYVHCRAGVGRTGTVIAAYYLASKIEKGEVTQENLNEYSYNLILDLRMQRDKNFVQKFVQFQLLMSYARQLLEEKLSN